MESTGEFKHYDLSRYNEDPIKARDDWFKKRAELTQAYIKEMTELGFEDFMFQRFVRGIWSNKQAFKETEELLAKYLEGIEVVIANAVYRRADDYLHELTGKPTPMAN